MRKFYIGLTATALFLMHGLWNEEHSLAATRCTEDLADLARMAQAVVEVEVIDTQSAGISNSTPLTVAHVKILKTWKGKIAEAEIAVEYIGGTCGDQRTIATGQPVLTASHRYVLLVSKFPQVQNWRVVGGDAGEVELISDQEHTAAVRPEHRNFEYFEQDGKSLTGFKRVNCAVMSEEAFRGLLQEIVATGKPVLGARQAAVETPVPVQQEHNAVPQTGSTALLIVRLLCTVALTTFVWYFGTRYIATKRSAQIY